MYCIVYLSVQQVCLWRVLSSPVRWMHVNSSSSAGRSKAPPPVMHKSSTAAAARRRRGTADPDEPWSTSQFPTNFGAVVLADSSLSQPAPPPLLPCLTRPLNPPPTPPPPPPTHRQITPARVRPVGHCRILIRSYLRPTCCSMLRSYHKLVAPRPKSSSQLTAFRLIRMAAKRHSLPRLQ